MDRKLLDLCSNVYRHFYTKDREFRSCVEENGKARLTSFDNCTKLYFKDKNIFYPVEGVGSMELTNIFDYKDDCLEWYLFDVSSFKEITDEKEEIHIRVFEVDSNNYPKKEDILEDRLDSFLWCKQLEIPKEVSELFRKLSNSNKDVNIRRLHMVNDCLQYSMYDVCDTVSLSDDGRNSYINHIVVWSSSLDVPVKEIYWFSKGNFVKARCRRNSDGEYTLVVL